MLGLGNALTRSITGSSAVGGGTPPEPPGTLPLDLFPDAAAAYSVRKLRTDYAGAAIRVRRASDNTEQDIGFDRNGDLDTSALATFCAGANGFVAVWFDQSSGGNDLKQTQPTTSAQPKVYDSVTGVVTNDENGLPCIGHLSTATTQMSTTSTISGTSSATLLVAMHRISTGTETQPVPAAALSDGANTYAVQSDNTETSNAYLRHAFPTFAITTFGEPPTIDGIYLAQVDFASGTGVAKKNNDQSRNVSYAPANTSLSAFNINLFFSGTGNRGDGQIQEVVCWPNDTPAAQEVIDAVNDYYSIYSQSPTGLLADYPGAAAAYSLRQLISTAQLAIAVRRDSDDAVLGIGFVNGELDTTTLATFCSGANGFVAAWFDQSGNGNHATQATPGSQPKVYDGTAGEVVTQNGKAAVEFNGTSSRMTSAMTVTSDFTTSVVLKASTASQSNQWLLQDTSGTDMLLRQVNTNFNWFDGTSYDIGTAGTDQHHIFVTANASGSVVSFDGADQSISGIANNGYTDLEIGADSGSREWHGKFQEIVIWGQYQSDNRADIETNINDHYSIYTP